MLVVGDCWSREDMAKQKAFSGGAGSVIDYALRQQGLDADTIFKTVVFNQAPVGKSTDSFLGSKPLALPNYRALGSGKYVRKEFEFELQRLEQEIQERQPNVIIAAGNFALWALTKKAGIKRHRGTPMPSHADLTRADGTPFKVLPTYAPETILRQWKMRPIFLSDLAKAIREEAFPEIVRPRREIWCNPTLADIEQFYERHIKQAPYLSCDIETKGNTITEVGYSVSKSLAIVIPFFTREKASRNYWASHADERKAWDWVRRINQEKKVIGQNFMYDMSYFWQIYGITCPRVIGDTMLLHHAMQPEMEKGLGFLGSIYTDEPSWKFMRTDHSTIKTED